MTAQFAIVVQAQADFICLILKGELDLAALPDLKTTFARIAGDHPERAVQVDLTNATFIDSTIVGALVTARRDAAARGTSLTVTNARGLVERVLIVSGVHATLGDPEL